MAGKRSLKVTSGMSGLEETALTFEPHGRCEGCFCSSFLQTLKQVT